MGNLLLVFRQWEPVGSELPFRRHPRRMSSAPLSSRPGSVAPPTLSGAVEIAAGSRTRLFGGSAALQGRTSAPGEAAEKNHKDLVTA